MECPDVKVTFLPLNCVPDLSKKSKYNKLFDVIYFSNRYVITGLTKSHVSILWANFTRHKKYFKLVKYF